MCTLSFWPVHHGYRVAMNRDEQRSRVAGITPAARQTPAGWVLHPTEPTGGTWISINSSGVGFGLINWYSQPQSVPGPRQSRGRVIREIGHLARPEDVALFLNPDVLRTLPPFRLIGWFPASRAITEWRCIHSGIEVLHHPWEPGQWISSGFDEPGAQARRSDVFNVLRTLPDAGSWDWLRQLHASHSPAKGPYSTCMHRDDAETVSYTEMEVSPDDTVMRYGSGPPCQLAFSLAEFRLPTNPASQPLRF